VGRGRERRGKRRGGIKGFLPLKEGEGRKREGKGKREEERKGTARRSE